MKLRKIIYSVSAVALSAVMLSACSNSSSKSSDSSSAKSSKVEKSSSSTKKTTSKKVAGADLKDGKYRLLENDVEDGYRVEMSMIVKGGKVIKTTYKELDKNGKTLITKETKQLNKDWAANANDPRWIDSVKKDVDGAHRLQNYAVQLFSAAQKGKTSTIHIKNTDKYHDGTYKLTEKNPNKNGYRQTYVLVIKNGKVSSLTYDQIDKDGKSIKTSTNYTKNDGVNSATPKKYMTKLMQEFKDEDYDIDDVKVVPGAVQASNEFIAYVGQLLNAAQNNNARFIHVDNIVYSEKD
ncbi:FMN-binding protein [Lactobacillus sp.]|uniref:FMN-binding protein n=1 Tax=Lactobacillus sp. TaxID=1591 RepID=UPI0019C748ED|nr:FMN-binding protein [Lactobacillus sp.]MBD5429761.1 FMN-binding protein [Lactobacillus sp.]